MAGQHSYTAAIRKKDDFKGLAQPLPKWCHTFNCVVLRPELDTTTVEVVAGRVQPQSANIVSMSFADTAEFFHDLVKRH